MDFAKLFFCHPVGTKDGAAKVFGTRGVERLLSPPSKAPVSCMVFAQGLGFLVVGTQLPALHVYNLKDNTRSAMRCTTIELHEFPVSLEAPMGSGYLNIGMSGTEVRFLKFGEEWLSDYKISESDLRFGKESTDIVAACSHPSGALSLLVAGRAGHLVIWDLRARAVGKRFAGAGTGAELMQAAWSPDAKLVAAGYADGVILLWAADSDKAVFTKLAPSNAGLSIVCMEWHALGAAYQSQAASGSSKRDRREPKGSAPEDYTALIVLAAPPENASAAGGHISTEIALYTGHRCEKKTTLPLADLASSSRHASADGRVTMTVCLLARRTTPGVVMLVTDGGAMDAVPLSLTGTPKSVCLHTSSLAPDLCHTLPAGPMTCLHHMTGVPISLLHSLLQDASDEPEEWEDVSMVNLRTSPMDPMHGGGRPCPPLTSPAPALLVTGHADGAVHVWDVRTESLLPLAGARVQRPLDLWDRDIAVFETGTIAGAAGNKRSRADARVSACSLSVGLRACGQGSEQDALIVDRCLYMLLVCNKSVEVLRLETREQVDGLKKVHKRSCTFSQTEGAPAGFLY